MITFDVSNVSIFLEPPVELFPQYKNTIVFYQISKEEIPDNFFQDSGKELKLDWRLSDYLQKKQPPVQLVERIDDEVFQNAISVEAHTRNMWDCCYSIFDTKVASHARVSLLVEYELNPRTRMDDSDCQFLFLVCRKLYFQALGEYTSLQRGVMEMQARSQAWSQATRAMREIYGIPSERMEAIAREGSQRWLSPSPNAGRIPYTTLQSYPHTPRFVFVVPKPKEQKIYFEVR